MVEWLKPKGEGVNYWLRIDNRRLKFNVGSAVSSYLWLNQKDKKKFFINADPFT